MFHSHAESREGRFNDIPSLSGVSKGKNKFFFVEFYCCWNTILLVYPPPPPIPSYSSITGGRNRVKYQTTCFGRGQEVLKNSSIVSVFSTHRTAETLENNANITKIVSSKFSFSNMNTANSNKHNTHTHNNGFP